MKDRTENGLFSTEETELLDRVCKQQMQYTEDSATCCGDLLLIKDLNLFNESSLAPALVEDIMSKTCLQTMTHQVRRLISATCSLRTVTKKKRSKSFFLSSLSLSKKLSLVV